MFNVGDGIKKDVKSMIRDMKDLIIPRKLGYVECMKPDNLPDEQRLAKCYRPIDNNVAHLVKSGSIHEIDTLDKYASGTISAVQRDLPKFKGLIFEPQLGNVPDIKKAMQIYADKYNLPICAAINGRYLQLQPIQVVKKITRNQVTTKE